MENCIYEQVSPTAAAAQCQTLEYEDVGGYAKIDTHRFARTGFPEVVYAEGKTSDQVAQILELMVRKDVDPNVMATRVTPESVEAIRNKVAPVRSCAWVCLEPLSTSMYSGGGLIASAF